MKICVKTIIIFTLKCLKSLIKHWKNNHGQKSTKISSVICGDTEPIFQKIYSCDNNLEESSATKI